ncbi:MAG: hypothetical protein R3C45_19505 [Phycisphaerales bacterium]
MTGKLFKLSAIGLIIVGITDFATFPVHAVSIEARVLSGDPAPDTTAGVVYNRFSDLVINELGHIAFNGFIAGPNVNGNNNNGIWSESSGNLSLIARRGQIAPGTGGSAVFFALSKPLINSSGQTIFLGTLNGEGVNLNNYTGIWLGDSSNVNLVARGGDAIPAIGPGVALDFNRFFESAVFNNAGEVIFASAFSGIDLDGLSKTGIWSGGFGELSIVVKSGDQSPDEDPGIVYARTTSAALNDAGHTAFRGSITSRDCLVDSLAGYGRMLRVNVQVAG